MLKLSRKTLFAVEAVLDIAYNATELPVQSRDITARQEIPRRYLEQVLQQLVRARILTGVRGPRGGYRLAKERRRITVGAIVRAIHEDEAEVSRSGDAMTEDAKAQSSGHGSNGSDLGEKIVRPMWDDALADMMARLDRVTVQDLCVKASEYGIENEGSRRLDYAI